MRPGVSRLSTMQSPGPSKSQSRLKSLKRSLLSFVHIHNINTKSPISSTKDTQRRSFPTPATATSATPSSTSTRKRVRNIDVGGGNLPPPPFAAEPSEASQLRGIRKQRVFQKNGSLLYEWEQNATHVTLRLPPSYSLDTKVLIAPSFLQVGTIHREHPQKNKPRLEWKLHHTTGGTINVQGSTWTSAQEHQMPDQGTIITLCKARPGVPWAYALRHPPREEVQTKLCRPPRTKQRRPPKKQDTSLTSEETRPSFSSSSTRSSMKQDARPSFVPSLSIKKKKTKKTKPDTSLTSEETRPSFSSSVEEVQVTRPSFSSDAPKSPPLPIKKKKKKKKMVSTPSPSPNPKKKKRVSAADASGGDNQKRASTTTTFDKPQQESAYFVQKQNSKRRSIEESEPSTRTHTTKPSSFSSLHDGSPSRRNSRFQVHKEEEQEEEDDEQDLDASLNRSSLFSMMKRQGSSKSFANEDSLNRSSIFSIMKKQGSSSRILEETPKRFSKPTSRISMEVKKAGSSRSIGDYAQNNNTSTRSIDCNSSNKPPSRISLQIKQRLSGDFSSKKIVVPSKASLQDQKTKTRVVPSKAYQMDYGSSTTSTTTTGKNNNSHSNSQSLDFVGHGGHGAIATLTGAKLASYLEKPAPGSNDSQFKSSVSTNNTSKAASIIMMETMKTWTASSRHSPKEQENMNPEQFMQELEMSYSRLSTLL